MLRAYLGGSQQAFTDLVARHADWVYGAARRHVGGDAHLAEDVAQATFVVLSQRARELGEGTVVSAWLFRVVGYVSANARRAAARRRRHEKRAAAMVDPHPMQVAVGATGEWDEIAARLEQLVAKLGGADRQAVLLRFYQRKDYAQIAVDMGTTNEAARKRVGRAVEKLGVMLGRRGVRVSVAALATLLLTGAAEAAPSGFVMRTTSIVRDASGATPAEMLASRALRDITQVRLLRILTVAAAVILLLMLAPVAFNAARDRAPLALPATPAARSDEALAPTTAPATQAVVAAIGSSATAGAGPFRVASGWPVALPGTVTGSPALADVDGDGALEIIVPCRRRNAIEPLAHPNPSYAAHVFALRLDGAAVPGWPVQIVDAVATPNATKGVAWHSSPSVYPAGDGRDGIAVVAPFRRGLRLIDNGVVRAFPRAQVGVYQSLGVPVADLRGDGRWGAFTASLVIGVDGSELRGWPKSKLLNNGIAPCIGDADGDGSPEVFHTFAVSFDSAVGTIGGFDASGRALPGWPQSFRCPIAWPPVMGDVARRARRNRRRVLRRRAGVVARRRAAGRPARRRRPPRRLPA